MAADHCFPECGLFAVIQMSRGIRAVQLKHTSFSEVDEEVQHLLDDGEQLLHFETRILRPERPKRVNRLA